MPQKGTSTLRMRVCRQCGIEFMGGPRAWYCPTCRIERQREQGRKCKQRQLTMEQEKQCAHQDLVEIFQTDNCTKAEAERHIKNGSEAIKASEWEQHIKDNDLRDGEGELLSAEDAKKVLDARSVTVDGEEYFLLYVL